MKDYSFFMTSYPPRMNNLQRVVETLKAQTVRPKAIVLTVARSQYDEMRGVVGSLGVDVYITQKDTKGYKKFLPAMTKYCKPEELLICVDDDKLYLPNMAECMLQAHERWQAPISGNHYWHNGLKCHCGNGSLVWPKMFDGWQQYEDLFGTDKIPCDDMFLTMLAAQNKYAYKWTDTNWEKANIKYNEGVPFTVHGVVQKTYEQTAKLFGWVK